jgi:hypothetical protein
MDSSELTKKKIGIYPKLVFIADMFIAIENRQDRIRVLHLLFEYYYSTTSKDLLTSQEYEIKMEILNILRDSMYAFISGNYLEPADKSNIDTKLQNTILHTHLQQNINKYLTYADVRYILYSIISEKLVATKVWNTTKDLYHFSRIENILDCFGYSLKNYKQYIHKNKVNLFDL